MGDDGTHSLTLTLSGEQLEALVTTVTTRVLEQVSRAEPERLLTVDEVAEILSVATEWVRRHQALIGAIRLSDGGGRNPIRFRRRDVERFLTRRQIAPFTADINWRSDPDWAARP